MFKNTCVRLGVICCLLSCVLSIRSSEGFDADIARLCMNRLFRCFDQIDREIRFGGDGSITVKNCMIDYRLCMWVAQTSVGPK
jgi:hypothetical protein